MNDNNNQEKSEQVVAVRRKLVELIHHPGGSKDTRKTLSRIVELLIKE